MRSKSKINNGEYKAASYLNYSSFENILAIKTRRLAVWASYAAASISRS
jgi:hypothetical protein